MSGEKSGERSFGKREAGSVDKVLLRGICSGGAGEDEANADIIRAVGGAEGIEGLREGVARDDCCGAYSPLLFVLWVVGSVTHIAELCSVTRAR